MAEKDRQNLQRLTELRAKIDAVDESIHGLLMQRAMVIDELIRVKGAGKQTGAAFRPGREADMMRILAERHHGSIPITMITHVWREIIATFTWLQAPYSVHVAEAGNPGLMRDTARFHFGFTVPLAAHATADDAIEGARAEGNALAIVPERDRSCWWQHLDMRDGLAVMAKLPVMNARANAGPALADSFVIAPPLADPVPFEFRLYCGHARKPIRNWSGGSIVAEAPDSNGKPLTLVSIPAGGSAPQDLLDIRPVGGYFAAAGGASA